MGLKIQKVSDLHIDHPLNYQYCVNKLFSSGDVLLVAGDTCQYTYDKRNKFINTVFSRFPIVIETPGNHDSYFLSNKWECAKHVKKKTTFKNGNVHYFVNNDFVDIGDVRFICTTLWSEINQNIIQITRSLNDYHLIKEYTIDENNERHKFAKRFLEDTIEATPIDKKIVVMTHHLPMYELIEPKYVGSELNEAYASNMSSFLYRHSHRINFWVHGHSHGLANTKMYDTVFIRNPLGYLAHNEGKDFNPSLVIEL